MELSEDALKSIAVCAAAGSCPFETPVGPQTGIEDHCPASCFNAYCEAEMQSMMEQAKRSFLQERVPQYGRPKIHFFEPVGTPEPSSVGLVRIQPVVFRSEDSCPPRMGMRLTTVDEKFSGTGRERSLLVLDSSKDHSFTCPPFSATPHNPSLN